MFPCSGFGYGLRWIFPLIMIVMMVLCFFMMKTRASSGQDTDFTDKQLSKGETNAD